MSMQRKSHPQLIFFQGWFNYLHGLKILTAPLGTNSIKLVVLDVLVSVCAANNIARACYIMMSFCKRTSWCHNCLFTLLLILVNFKSLLQPQFLTNFDKQGCILKLRISSFQPCIICEDPWWFTYESQKQWPNLWFRVFFAKRSGRIHRRLFRHQWK